MTTTVTAPGAPRATRAPRTTTSWFLRDDAPRTTEPTIPRGIEYHRALAGEKRRIGRGILAIVLVLAGLVGFAIGLRVIADTIDAEVLGRSGYTPLSYGAGMLALALLIPWSMGIQRVLYGVRGPSLHSVAHRFRYGLLGRGLLVLAPFWALTVTLGLMGPAEQIPWTSVDLIAYLLITVLLVPLQAAGEEYAFRGLVFRAISGGARNPRVGLVVGVILSSVLFASIHGTLDPYMLTWYVALAISLALITWRTGGIELAVLLHAVLNTVTLLGGLVLHIDLPEALNSRATTVGTPMLLIPAAVVLVITAVVWATTRRSGAVTNA